jgi:hypothetical protein
MTIRDLVEEGRELTEEATPPKITKFVDTYETDDYPSGRHRVKAIWTVEKKGKKSRVARVTHHPKTGYPAKPKKSTYGLLTKIGLGADGRTYIVKWTGAHLSFLKGDMKFTAGSIHSRDPEFIPMMKRLIKANHPGDPMVKSAEQYIKLVQAKDSRVY